MNLNEYQERAGATAIYPREDALEYTLFGLFGEAGEIANKYKKTLRDDHGILTTTRRVQMLEELGDVLWYVAMVAKELGVTLEEVGAQNITKLRARWMAGKLHGEGDNR